VPSARQAAGLLQNEVIGDRFLDFFAFIAWPWGGWLEGIGQRAASFHLFGAAAQNLWFEKIKIFTHEAQTFKTAK